ncbi:hypothetical protein HMSSN036_96530 [Paenibacillus macerans]|nr:hypothetical protein HMSSN036_96530 [Paenibacillus macerans]
MKGRKLAYFDLHGLWIALNQEDIPRDKENRTYTHIAFTIEETDFDAVLDKLRQLSVEVLPGRERDVRDKNRFIFSIPTGICLNSIRERWRIVSTTTGRKKAT